MEIPKIIFTKEIPSDLKQKIRIPNEELIELIQVEGRKTIFCDDHARNKSELFYIIKEGMCLIGTGSLDAFDNLYSIKENGYDNLYEFLEALHCGVNSHKEFEDFKSSSFYHIDKTSYKEYLKAKEKGFDNKGQYSEANRLGIQLKIEFDEYIKSKIKPYEEYLKAKKGGFKSNQMFLKAQEQGIDNLKDFLTFLRKNYHLREEKIKEILNDSATAYDSENPGEFIRLQYLLIEKVAELTLMKILKDIQSQFEEEFKLDETLSKIENSLNEKILEYEELNYWRQIRNEIVHEHKKVSKDTMEKAKIFFTNLYSSLDNISIKTLKEN